MNFKTAKTEEDLKKCFPVIHELRPHLNLQDYLQIYQDAHRADQYEIVYAEDQGHVVAVMGYRFLSDFVRGRHLYIDDLVTTENGRAKGFGSELLKFAEEIAKKSDCKTLRLCTGVENERGVRFYERNAWTKRAFAYTKKI